MYLKQSYHIPRSQSIMILLPTGIMAKAIYNKAQVVVNQNYHLSYSLKNYSRNVEPIML